MIQTPRRGLVRRQCVCFGERRHSGEKLHGEIIICQKVLKPEAIHLPPEHQNQHLNGVCFENGEARRAAHSECPDGFARHQQPIWSFHPQQPWAPFVPWLGHPWCCLNNFSSRRCWRFLRGFVMFGGIRWSGEHEDQTIHGVRKQIPNDAWLFWRCNTAILMDKGWQRQSDTHSKGSTWNSTAQGWRRRECRRLLSPRIYRVETRI